MRCSAVSWCWNRLLGQWKKYLDGEVLARQDALLLMGRTVREVQRGRQEQRISFLATRGHSVAVWKVLDRQRTAWKDCLALFEIQIASFSPLRRSFLEGCLVAFPKLWKRLSYAMLSAWHPEEKFLAVYTQLMASETIVQFISIVSAAIREQPQLGGILPVSHLVLLRCYELGKAQPETALSCCRIVALAKPELLSRAEREELAFGYAMLFAFRDQWGVALSVLNASREVRPSAKRLFWLHISRMGQWVKAVQCHETLEPSFITSAIEHASHWSYALRVYEQWKTHDAAQALIARKDVIDTIGWEASLCLCRLSGIRSYGLLRPVLSAIPDNHPQRMQLLSNAIRVTEESMYAGTLTRRAFQFVKRGKWMDAIGLLCGCRYFDVALPIVPYAPKGAVLPHELLSFEEAVCRMKLPSSPKDVLSFEDQMAAALCRKWRHVGTLPTNARLKSLMLARGVLHHLADSPGVKENGEVQCFTFQSGELSRLVCLAAGSKTQQYFRKVIPRELHEHHFGSRRVEGQFVTSQKYEAFLTAGAVVVDGEGCNSLCAMVVEHLRAYGNLTGEIFIRELSRCLAAGRIQLPLVCRHELSLAVLRAAFHFHRLDSTLTARIALTTPSHYLAARPDALGSCVNALLLTGKWERAISLARKAEPPNPHSIAALAYVAPRPVALATLKVLWRANPQDRSTLLLQDLLHGDTRRAMDELRVSAPGVKAARGKNDVQWRRRVLGACCCLIRSSQSMLSVVREAGLSSFCALDVDEHGLQRLIHVLPWEKALTAISDADGNNEVVDEHWVLTVCVKPQIPAEAVGKGVSLFRYSALLNTVLVYHQSVEQKALQAAIKAVARYQEVVLTDYNADKIYLRTLVTLLRGVLQRFDDDEWKTTSPWLVVRRVFNQAVETLEMTQMGRDARRCLPASLREDKPLHAFLIIGFFYHEMSRSLQIPILASITSKLLGVAARETRDFMAALYFFKCLKQPTNHERSLLVFALRDVSDAMSLLMTAGRFVHPRPEQVLVWSDSARGSERWMLSIELLSQSPPPREKLVELCQGWSWAEALRTLELLRRIKGSSPEAETYSTLVRECHPSARGAAMRFLGAGACSVVMALSEEEAREWCDSVPAPLLWQLALRLSTRITRCCPVCCDLLTDFVGFQFDIEITENLKGRCAAAYPPLADRCMTALHAQLITNFSFDPRLIQECCTPHNYIGASSGIARLGISQRSGLTIEVKPKGLWKFPSVVGIVVDSVEYYLHPMKLRQCRYSLMQLLKCKKRSGAYPATSSDRSSYCPNHLMLGDESSIVVALRRLVEQPANNMGVVSEGHTLEDISEESLHVVSVALHRSGVLPRLADLQLFGSASDHEIPVLDVELLFRWSTARDMSSVKWIVTVPSEPALPSVDCCCQSGIHPLCRTTTQKRSFNTRFIAPMLDFGECVKRFYASMTAKDVSLLVSLSSLAEGVLSSCLKPPSSPVAELSATSGGITSEEVSSFRYAHGGVVVSVGHPAVAVCRVGVVDVDDKSHKSLSHYFHRDHEVLAAWEEYCLLNPSSSHH